MITQEQYNSLKPYIAKAIVAKVALEVATWKLLEKPDATDDDAINKAFDFLPRIMNDIVQPLPKEIGAFFDQGVQEFQREVEKQLNHS